MLLFLSLTFLTFSTLVDALHWSHRYKRGAACPQYIIISTRGTGEMQGQSMGFRMMNQAILQAIPGGKEHDTVYTADFSQNSAMGTNDIVSTVTAGLRQNPNLCFLLEGYSQGAAATINALRALSSPMSLVAVRGVIVIGNPMHKPNALGNVDESGGGATKSVTGIQAMMAPAIPQQWQSKILDICATGDMICSGGFNMMPHMSYGTNSKVAALGLAFAKKVLTGSGNPTTQAMQVGNGAGTGTNSANPGQGSNIDASASGLKGGGFTAAMPGLGESHIGSMLGGLQRGRASQGLPGAGLTSSTPALSGNSGGGGGAASLPQGLAGGSSSLLQPLQAGTMTAKLQGLPGGGGFASALQAMKGGGVGTNAMPSIPGLNGMGNFGAFRRRHGRVRGSPHRLAASP